MSNASLRLTLPQGGAGRASPQVTRIATSDLYMFLCKALLASLSVLLGFASGANAQGTPLKPPMPSVAPAAASAPAASAAPALATIAIKANPMALTRFKTLKVGGKLVDLSTMRDTDVLKGSSGRTISVARIKQLQARIDGASTAPVIVAKPGQSLKTLAAAPAGTRVQLPNGKVARIQELSRVQTIYAKLNQKRVIKPVPLSMPNARAQAVVGENGLTIADALKKPAGEVIQVGSRKYTAEQLRTIDTQLKASKREPRGLIERATIKVPRTGLKTNVPPATPRNNLGEVKPKGVK